MLRPGLAHNFNDAVQVIRHENKSMNAGLSEMRGYLSPAVSYDSPKATCLHLIAHNPAEDAAFLMRANRYKIESLCGIIAVQ